MRLFGKKKTDEKLVEKQPEEPRVLCPHCFLDYKVSQIEASGGICPSCKGKIDLTKLPRAKL